ncbi:SRPBCC family protein [Mariniblastus fucicola]|uniref:Polyketide cyclase / dehydrase and lipid transport n=1 Tax=Mariniblastus fucicola TaxID=980251 RepID=A0A5B9P293_9BACT|nr:SRPBCC family protein [Mariniblastus fucicola]QEG20314.1 hypothetical protein MFFC18_01610 [Mariniblastus fucicola]
MSFFTKIILFLFGLAVLAVVSAWIMGGESLKHSSRISIEASPRQVFPYLASDERISQWASNVLSAGPYSGDSESEAMRLSRVVLEDGEETVWQDSVLRYLPPEAISIQSKKGGLTNTLVFQLNENEIGGTTLLYRLTKSASGLEQFLFALQDDNSKVTMADDLAKLKALIESEVELGDDIEEFDELGDEVAEDEDEGEDEAPVVTSPSSGNNANEPNPKAQPKSTGVSVIDQVLGPVNGKVDNKPKDGERNFESLFGTGR